MFHQEIPVLTRGKKNYPQSLCMLNALLNCSVVILWFAFERIHSFSFSAPEVAFNSTIHKWLPSRGTDKVVQLCARYAVQVVRLTFFKRGGILLRQQA